MKRALLKWLFYAVALIVAAKVTEMFMPGFSVVPIKTAGDFFTVMLGALVLGLVNSTLGRIVKFLTLPLTCLTLGLFTLVVNAAMLMLAGSLEIGFKVDGFLPALVGSTVLAVVYGLLGILIPDEDKKD
jgi:putative membrane protein